MVAEEDYTALGDEEGEFVSLLVCKVFELKADNFGADVGGQMLNFFRGGEKGCLVFVCASSGVHVFAVFIPDSVDILEV